jgi:hypothetical protein
MCREVCNTSRAVGDSVQEGIIIIIIIIIIENVKLSFRTSELWLLSVPILQDNFNKPT